MFHQTVKRVLTSKLVATMLAATMLLGTAGTAVAEPVQAGPAPQPQSTTNVDSLSAKINSLTQENVRLTGTNDSLAATNARLAAKNRNLKRENDQLRRLMLRFRGLYVKAYGKLRALMRRLSRMFGPWRSAKASWYGPGFYGGPLASGGTLRPGMKIFAHRSMRFGTKVQFAYGGRRVIAVCRDRGPFIAGRTFDLGPGTAKSLRFDGVGTVRWRIVRR